MNRKSFLTLSLLSVLSVMSANVVLATQEEYSTEYDPDFGNLYVYHEIVSDNSWERFGELQKIWEQHGFYKDNRKIKYLAFDKNEKGAVIGITVKTYSENQPRSIKFMTSRAFNQ